MPDPKVLARRIDAPRRLELGREDPEVDVGQEAAQHQQAVGLLDALGHLGPAHRPLVDAHEERVPLGDDALAQDRRRDRHPGLLGQGEQLVLETEAVDLDVGQDHRPLGRGEHRLGLVERLAERLGVARRQADRGPVRRQLPGVDLVAGDLQVDRPLVPERRLEHPVDLVEGRQRVVEHGRGDRDLLEDLELRLEPLDLVVQERVPRPLREPRRAAQHDHRRLLRISAGDAVAEREPADAVGHADATQAVQPGVRVGGEPGGVFARHADDLKRPVFEHLVEGQNVVAGDAEDVPDPQRGQAIDQVAADGRPRFGSAVLVRGHGRRGGQGHRASPLRVVRSIRRARPSFSL